MDNSEFRSSINETKPVTEEGYTNKELETIHKLKNVYLEQIKCDIEYQESIFCLEQKQEAKYNALYDRRKEILEEFRMHSDYHSNNKLQYFWLNVLNAACTEPISRTDAHILKHLVDIRSHLELQPSICFILKFYFKKNSYFTNDVLTKTYYMKHLPNPKYPLTYDGTEIYKCKGCTINWTIPNPPKKYDPTLDIFSFVNFFNPPKKPRSKKHPNYIYIQKALQKDFEFGFYLKERVLPKAILFYTKEIAVVAESKSESESSQSDELSDVSQVNYKTYSADRVNKEYKEKRTENHRKGRVEKAKSERRCFSDHYRHRSRDRYVNINETFTDIYNQRNANTETDRIHLKNSHTESYAKEIKHKVSYEHKQESRVISVNDNQKENYNVKNASGSKSIIQGSKNNSKTCDVYKNDQKSNEAIANYDSLKKNEAFQSEYEQYEKLIKTNANSTDENQKFNNFQSRNESINRRIRDNSSTSVAYKNDYEALKNQKVVPCEFKDYEQQYEKNREENLANIDEDENINKFSNGSEFTSHDLRNVSRTYGKYESNFKYSAQNQAAEEDFRNDATIDGAYKNVNCEQQYNKTMKLNADNINENEKLNEFASTSETISQGMRDASIPVGEYRSDCNYSYLNEAAEEAIRNVAAVKSVYENVNCDTQNENVNTNSRTDLSKRKSSTSKTSGVYKTDYFIDNHTEACKTENINENTNVLNSSQSSTKSIDIKNDEEESVDIEVATTSNYITDAQFISDIEYVTENEVSDTTENFVIYNNSNRIYAVNNELINFQNNNTDTYSTENEVASENNIEVESESGNETVYLYEQRFGFSEEFKMKYEKHYATNSTNR